ncbi:MAG TPA: HIT family protein [Polyangiaceae bacterium]|jgi:histidine triad (HIT) family protein
MGAPGCVFCAIVRRETAAHLVLKTAACVAFLDTRPLFPGHTLVVPREHKETLADLDAGDIAAIFGAAQRIAEAQARVLGAEGTFVAMNDRVSQSVPHAHVHVVPRTKGDGLRGFFWPRLKYESDAAAAAVAEKLSTALAG